MPLGLNMEADEGHHEQRRRMILTMNDDQFREFVFEQLRIYENEFKQHRELLAQNTALTVEIAASTKQVVEIFQGAKTGAATFAWIGRNLRSFMKFIYPFVLVGGAIAAILHGKWPKWGE